ncbi:MAG: zinc-ribbon domain-containing protein [Ruminococcus sp.]|jgi:hypothetical protein|nr:zinc-ribbon domain-containing protein [Ruminococcus sp.]
MAFFDELGKKLSQTGQTVAQKTKNTTETIKLGGMVSDEEKRIHNTYLQIGKTYYENFSDRPDPLLSDFIYSINDSRSKIASYKEQIEQLKGISRCANCGSDLPKNSTFCSNCGASVAAPAAYGGAPTYGAPETMPGQQVGQPMGQPMAQQPIPQQPMAQPIPQPVSPPVSLACSNCGVTLSPNAAFCTNCGNKIN